MSDYTMAYLQFITLKHDFTNRVAFISKALVFLILLHLCRAYPELLKWFVAEYPKHASRKLDMGKSCVRFKKTEHIPYELIGE